MSLEKEKMNKVSPMSKFFIKKLVPSAIVPKKGTIGAAGYDLSSI